MKQGVNILDQLRKKFQRKQPKTEPPKLEELPNHALEHSPHFIADYVKTAQELGYPQAEACEMLNSLR